MQQGIEVLDCLKVLLKEMQYYNIAIIQNYKEILLTVALVAYAKLLFLIKAL